MSESNLPDIPAHLFLTPEFQLITVCSWIAPPLLQQDQRDKITALCLSGIDWDKFILLVGRHGVPALVYSCLGMHGGNYVPKDVVENLKQRKVRAITMALQHGAELIRIQKLFDDHGIEIIPLKGIMLSLRLYGDIGMRNSSDIDLLTKPQHIEKASRLLETMGYCCEAFSHRLTAKQKLHVRNNLHHFAYRNNNTGLTVELHWNIGPWRSLQMSLLWSHISQITWMECQINVLNDDALLLSLCDHGAKHKWVCLKWLGDVATLLAGKTPDTIDHLISLADQLGLRRTLAQTSLLVFWLYGLQPSKPLISLINGETKTFTLASDAMAELLTNRTKKTKAHFVTAIAYMLYIHRLKPSLPYLNIIRGFLISLHDFREFPLPDYLFWLYYPLRPIFWFCRYYLK